MSGAGMGGHLVVAGNDFRLDVDLRLQAGRTTAILGPNGAGKSTLLGALAGTRRLEEGRLDLDGAVLDEPATQQFVPPALRRLGVVFQSQVLFPHLSALDNITFGPMAAGEKRAAAEAAARELMAELGLDPSLFARRRPRELSGGQAQRVALARALAVRPRALLLDEPLAALDLATRAGVRRLLTKQLPEFTGPRLLITHDPTDALLLADDMVIIENGSVSQQGTPEMLRRHPSTQYVAELAGVNLLEGNAEGGMVELAGGGALQSADTSVVGAVLVRIHPTAVALHPQEPVGSPRNTWLTRVETIEPLGDTVRVQLAGPVPLRADVTPGAVASLSLVPGSSVWAAIKATEVGLAATL